MKLIIYIICFAMAFAGCRSGHNHDYDHDHATHDHGDRDAHDHDHDHESETAEARKHDPAEIVILPAQAEVAGLCVEPVWPKPFDMVIKTSGQIRVTQGNELVVAASANGIVSFAKTLTEGSAVNRGETLLSISSRNMLEGDPVAKAKLTYELAEREYCRAKLLVKDALMSQREFDRMHTDYETAKVSYDALAESQTAKGVKVTSGIGGFVKSRLVTEGEYVVAGQPLVIVTQNRRLQLKCDVPERYYDQLSTITSANFKMPYDDTLYRMADLNGRLLSYGRSADDASFYIPVTFDFDNIANLLPGAFAEVYLITRPADNVIALPLSALIEEQGLYFVFVQADEEDAYKKREVKRGADNGRDVRILSGLKPGEKVVTQGTMHVKLASNASAIPEHSHSH